MALAGCSGTAPEAVESSRQPVAFGQPSGSEDDGILEVLGNTGSVINNCTGSLIAENLVLTARHCVAYYVEDTFTCTATGDLTPDSKGGQMGATLDPAKISVRIGATPTTAVAALGKQVFAAQATTICRNDIAVVLLDRPVTGLPIVPLRLLTGDSPGETVRLVGYGVSETPGAIIRRTRAGLVVSMVGSSSFRPQGDAVPPRTLVTEGPAGCPGDSGGPILSAQSAIVGVFSQVTGSCTASSARDFFTEVAPFYDELFKPAFAAANADPTFEAMADSGAPSDAAGGEGGGAGAEVDSGLEAGLDSGVDSGMSAAGGAPDTDASDSGVSPPIYHLPPGSGGCKCHMAGAAGTTSNLPPLLAGLALLAGRMRRRRASLVRKRDR